MIQSVNVCLHRNASRLMFVCIKTATKLQSDQKDCHDIYIIEFWLFGV